jgi:hypothetical protein
MSNRYRDSSHYENHERAAELEDSAAHAHRVAEHDGKQPYLSGHEHSRQASEHPGDAHLGAPNGATVGHGIAAFGHTEIAALAYEFWEARGCPEGSPEEDWYRAAEELRSRAHTG